MAPTTDDGSADDVAAAPLDGSPSRFAGAASKVGRLASRDRVVSAAVLTGLGLRLAWVTWATEDTGEYPTDGSTYLRMARELAHGDTPTIGGRATAFFPPGYPALLAPLARLTDLTGTPSLVFAATLLNAVLGALTVGLTGMLAHKLFSRHAGRVAAWAMAVAPGPIFMTASVMSESFFTMLVVSAMIVAWIVAGCSLRRESFSRLALGLGLLVGLAVLVRGPGLALVAAPAFAVRTRTGGWKGALRPTALLLVGAVLLLGPWMFRNIVEVGVWTPMSTNTATAMCAGNRDGANGRWVETPAMLIECLADSPWDNREIIDPAWIPPGVEEEAQRQGVQMGDPDEREWYPRTVARATRWAVTHPIEELGLMARKAYYGLRDDADPQYIPDELRRDHAAVAGILVWVGNVWYWSVMAAVVAGLVLRRTARRCVLLWGSALGLFVFVLGGVAYPQFHLPMIPLLVVLASSVADGRRPGPDGDPQALPSSAPSHDDLPSGRPR